MDVQLQSVQGDGLGVLFDVEINDDSAIECELLEVWFQSQVVVLRYHVRGEELSSLNVDPTSILGHSSGSAHVVSPVRTKADRHVAQGGPSAAIDDGSG